ncbi:MAG: TIR domain-containing protein [Verrucomicrobium sp.]
MSPKERKKIAVITDYVKESFSESDWHALGQLTGQLEVIMKHPRLFTSLFYNDVDYGISAAEVLASIFTANEATIGDVIDHFDIDLWYRQKNPEKYQRLFSPVSTTAADFWKSGFLKVFVSHLSSNKARMSALKAGLATWGISAFIAHEDIEASREWRDEVEAGLETMEVLVAVVEPGFKESDWCAQEVGYALGRKVDIIPLRAGLDPFGFFGKYQGISIKGRAPAQVADEIAHVLLKKPQHREKVLQSMSTAFSALDSGKKLSNILALDGWSIVTDPQLKNVMEQASMSAAEKTRLKDLIARVGAFNAPEEKLSPLEDDGLQF